MYMYKCPIDRRRSESNSSEGSLEKNVKVLSTLVRYQSKYIIVVIVVVVVVVIATYIL